MSAYDAMLERFSDVHQDLTVSSIGGSWVELELREASKARTYNLNDVITEVGLVASDL